jgi:hypothetical protein
MARRGSLKDLVSTLLVVPALTIFWAVCTCAIVLGLAGSVSEP